MRVLLILPLFFFVGLLSAQAQNTETSQDPGAVMEFVGDSYDFGEIKQGDVVDHTFIVKNAGTKPLVITNVRASCGCTVPVKPSQPILPGKTGEIKVTFNSAGKIGAQTKGITVYSNGVPAQGILYLRGTINP